MIDLIITGKEVNFVRDARQARASKRRAAVKRRLHHPGTLDSAKSAKGWTRSNREIVKSARDNEEVYTLQVMALLSGMFDTMEARQEEMPEGAFSSAVLSAARIGIPAPILFALFTSPAGAREYKPLASPSVDVFTLPNGAPLYTAQKIDREGKPSGYVDSGFRVRNGNICLA